MDDVNVAESILPLGEFKARASKLLKDLGRQGSGPLVVTQNGRPAAVVLSPSAFEAMRERQRFLEAVAVGVADADAGRVVGHEDVEAWIDTWGTEHEGEPPACE